MSKKGVNMRSKAEFHKLIVEAIKADRVWISSHAIQGMEERNLSLESVIDSAVCASIVEIEINFYYKRYSDPSCSIKGTTKMGVNVGSVWAYNKETKWATLITLYFRKSWFIGRVRR